MQLQVSALEIRTAYGQQLFNGKSSYVSIHSKTESISGLHQHGYYELTLALIGYYYQEVNGKHVLLEHGDFVFVPLGSYHQSSHDFGVTRIPNIGISKRFFEQHYRPPLPFCFIASWIYRANNSFLTYTETVIAPLNFRKSGLDGFVEVVTFYITNRLCHHHEEQVLDDVPQWLRATVRTIHNKRWFSENALKSTVHLSVEPQEHLTHATQRYCGKVPIQTINEIRINFAKKQLEMTSHLITDIAYEPGYSSSSLFIEASRKLTSFTPNSYRKKLIEFNQ